MLQSHSEHDVEYQLEDGEEENWLCNILFEGCELINLLLCVLLWDFCHEHGSYRHQGQIFGKELSIECDLEHFRAQHVPRHLFRVVELHMEVNVSLVEIQKRVISDLDFLSVLLKVDCHHFKADPVAQVAEFAIVATIF